MRLALLLILLGAAPVALAGPAIPAIASWLGVSLATAAIIVQVAITVAMYMYGSSQQRKAARKQAENARNEYNSGLQDRAITSIATESPHRYVYGRARVGSAIVALFTSGDRDQYKHLVCIHAAHECDAIEEYYINGKLVGPLDANGYTTTGPFVQIETRSSGLIYYPDGSAGPFGGEAHNGPSFNLNRIPNPGTLTLRIETGANEYAYPQFTISGTTVTLTGEHSTYTGVVKCRYNYDVVHPRVRIKTHLGEPGQAADAALMAALPAKWGSTAKLSGLCYSYIQLNLNHAEFQTGIPPIEVVVRGKKLYDPRSATTAWTQNNALVIRDYLLSEFCGVPQSDIPESEYITAANVCDEIGPFGKRYTFNGTVDADQNQSKVLESMAQSMAGGIVSTTWSVYAGKYVAPVAALEQADIVGAVSIIPGISSADLYNGVKGQYIDRANKYVATDFAPYQNSTYVSADGMQLWTNIDFPFTDEKQRVHNLCRIFTEDQRNGYTIRAEFSLKAWPRKIGERVTFTSALFGHSAKVFRITDKKYYPSGVVELTLKEDAAEIWDYENAVQVDVTPNTDLPNPFLIPQITGLNLASGTDHLLIQGDGTVVPRIHVTWDAVTTFGVTNGGWIEVECSLEGSVAARKLTVTGNETEAYIDSVEDGLFYEVKARAVSPYVNAKSGWAYAPLHQVIGKTAPPSDITDLSIDGSTIAWTKIADKDVAGYIFRYHYGVNTDWNSANNLHEGVITESPFDLITLPYGLVTIMGKAIDTSGNESSVTANIFKDLGDPVVRNVVAAINFDPLYSGQHSGCSVVGGDVVADSLDSFYGTDDQSFYGLDLSSFYEPSAFAQMVYVTNEFTIPTALIGSSAILDLATFGGDVTVEYQKTSPGTFYGADADPFYGADADPFYDTAPDGWKPWPGAIEAVIDGYQFRIIIGAGTEQGKITSMSLVIDAPDIIEVVPNVAISASGTIVPYTKNFAVITAIQATLQANASGAETVEVDKSIPLSPTLRAYNSAHVAVSGSTADITIQGY